jgi:hypothetical protein
MRASGTGAPLAVERHTVIQVLVERAMPTHSPAGGYFAVPLGRPPAGSRPGR